MEKGLIFDIRRFSTHDGDGIRTTIFLKGCPLSCAWCQNPEGIPFDRKVLHFDNRCMKCRKCINLAKKHGVTWEQDQILLHPQVEEDWDQLVSECPALALHFDSTYYTVDELLHEVMKDQPFYKHGGGGVTLSGGEPLAQSKFIISLLKCLQESHIHTAIETALSVPQQTIKNALPYLDQIYADFKIFDLGKHQLSTGVSNELIKDNLRFLLTSEKKDKIIIRTPLIPDYTAVEENIAQLASFISSIYSEVKYELLNYNPLAESKYHLVDREYCFSQNPPLYTAQEMRAFGDIAKKHGIRNLILEVE